MIGASSSSHDQSRCPVARDPPLPGPAPRRPPGGSGLGPGPSGAGEAPGPPARPQARVRRRRPPTVRVRHSGRLPHAGEPAGRGPGRCGSIATVACPGPVNPSSQPETQAFRARPRAGAPSVATPAPAATVTDSESDLSDRDWPGTVTVTLTRTLSLPPRAAHLNTEPAAPGDRPAAGPGGPSRRHRIWKPIPVHKPPILCHIPYPMDMTWILQHQVYFLAKCHVHVISMSYLFFKKDIFGYTWYILN